MLNIKRCHALELLSCKPEPNLMYAIFLTRGKNSVSFYIFLLKRNWKARVMNDHLTAIRHHILLTYWPMEQQALAPFPPPLSSHQTHAIEFHQLYNCKPKVFNSSEQNKAKRCEEKKNRNRNKTELFRIVKVPRRKDGEGKVCCGLTGKWGEFGHYVYTHVYMKHLLFGIYQRWAHRPLTTILTRPAPPQHCTLYLNPLHLRHRI